MVFSEYYREIEAEKCQPEESQNEYPIPSMKNQTSTSFTSGFSCVSQPSMNLLLQFTKIKIFLFHLRVEQFFQ